VRSRVALILLVAVAAAEAQASAAGSIDLLETFKTQIANIRRATNLPILLPRSLIVAGTPPRRVFAAGGPDRGGWVLTLAGAPRCGGANACFIASFDARRGKHLPEPANVRLVGGTPGFYLPIGCGASCSPASLWFVRGGVLYSWQVKDPPAGARAARAALIEMANEAIRAGPR
jgi:hypothetical protein